MPLFTLYEPVHETGARPNYLSRTLWTHLRCLPRVLTLTVTRHDVGITRRRAFAAVWRLPWLGRSGFTWQSFRHAHTGKLHPVRQTMLGVVLNDVASR